ncbi:MAG: MFS transporter [Coriobacteriales bacterium]|jgi:sugar phosphate permease|nr:MFS transporter [Coriobacteriales bacterium]
MDTNTTKPGRFFYGWWIVAGGFIIMATCYTIFVNCMSLFQAHIVRDLAISVGQFNTGVSLSTVVAIFASLAFGALVDKTSARLLGGLTVVVTAIVLLLLSFATLLWQFYVLCTIAGVIVIAGTRLLVSVLTTNWFNVRRGLAISIALSGSGFGGVVLSPLTSWIIVNYGWRMAFLLLAVICLIASLPIVIIMFRNRPSDKGLAPYGDNAREKASARQKEQKDTSSDTPVNIAVGWRVLRRSGGFWILILGFLCMGIVNGAIIPNAVSNMTSVVIGDTEIVTGGHSTIWAGNVWALYLGVVLVAKVMLGAIYDRLGLRAGTIIGTASCIIASLALCFPATEWAPIVAAFAFGFGTCMGTVSPPVMSVKQYGKKDLGMVVGIVTAFELFGAAIGAVLSGILFDSFHSFIPAWLMALAASVLMGVTLMLSIPAAVRIVESCRAKGAPQLDAEGFEINPNVETPTETGSI